MLDVAPKAFLRTHLRSYHAQPYAKGANSSGFLITCDQGPFFLKCYPNDASSCLRIYREFLFARHATHLAPAYVPKIKHFSTAHSCALFEFIEGEHFTQPSEVDIRQALDFLVMINRTFPVGQWLVAAEAALQLDDFKKIIMRRLQVFEEHHDSNSSLSSHVKTFLEKHLYPEITTQSTLVEVDTYLPIVFSPSDFGFHNAKKKQSHLIFFDFEYAGIDSAWKMLADFFAQPRFSVDLKYISLALKLFSLENHINQHKNMFILIYRYTLIKWVLIILKRCFKVNDPKEDKEVAFEYALKYWQNINFCVETMQDHLELL